MKLSELQVKEFVDLLASEAAAPGGGVQQRLWKGLLVWHLQPWYVV